MVMIPEGLTEAEKLYDLIGAQDRLFLAKTGAQNISGFPDGLMFDVRGSKFTGRVIIETNEENYKVTFGKIINFSWKELRTFNVQAEKLTSKLEKEIGV